LKKMDKGVWVVKSEVEGEKECNERLLYSERKEERTALGVLCTGRWPTTKYVRWKSEKRKCTGWELNLIYGRIY
jgi:hypothetical protein